MTEVGVLFADCHVFRTIAEGSHQWLVLKRAPHTMLGGLWAPVQGHIEPGEKAYETAHRELFEETGLRPRHFWQASYVNRFYLAERDQVILSPVFCAEVAAHAEVVLCDEHTEYKWLDAHDAMNHYMWPGQKKSLRICEEQFAHGNPRPESEISGLLKKD
jgi:dATP pyrophosphohydrolase